MTIAEAEKVDAIGQDKDTLEIVLSVFDHLPWDDERTHIMALEGKLNSYLEFVEGGQIFEVYPAAKTNAVRIDVLTKYPMPELGRKYIERANVVAAQLGIVIRQVYRPGSS